MIKLIKLEWKKNNIAKYMRVQSFWRRFSVCLYSHWHFWDCKRSGRYAGCSKGMGTISAPIELFTSMSFLIFTSVMLASFYRKCI